MCFLACQQAETGAWADFKKCATNACVKEAIAVKDAFLKDPKAMLENFRKAGEAGEDHFIGWLYIIRDSVLVNSAMGKTEERFAMQQAIIAAAQPFEKDPKVGDLASSITSEIGMMAIASELEDDIHSEDWTGFPLTGTYGFDAGDAGNGTLEIKQLSGEQLQFRLLVVGRAPAHNQGSMEGVIKNYNQMDGIGSFLTTEFGGECELEFSWVNEGLTIKTLKGDDAACGFGNAVVADGEYKRQSFDDPFLSKTEAKTAKNLVGEWVSTADPKAGLKIGEGVYQDTYEGSEPSTAVAYTYFSKCPDDCKPVAKTPCFKLFGQDEVCMTVVKADGKVLEISQVGGTGNTNRYKRK